MSLKIETPEVTFEVAKLLKEKGWDINTYAKCWVKTLDGEIIHNSERRNCAEHDRCEQYLMQPEIWMVVEWLRINHGIWVEVFKQRGVNGNGYNFMIVPTELGKNDSTPIINEEGYTSPKETYLAAFSHTLTNLI